MRRDEELDPYRGAGWGLIPLHPWDRTDQRGRPRGKSPRDPNWRRKEYSPRGIARWVEDGGNVGVRLGALQAVLDYDPRNDSDGSGLAALELELGRDFLDSCPRVRTGGGGSHWYVRLAEPTRFAASVPGMPGVELKGEGRQVVAAGSRHPNGRWYEWDDLSPPLADAPLLPQEFAALARRSGADPASEGAAEGELRPEQLAVLLAQLDPEDYRDHDAWLEVGMAAHHATGGEGLEEFAAWSAGDPAYADHGTAIRERWPTWRAEPGRPAVTLRTLFKHVRDAGGSLAGVYADAFPDDLPDLPEGAREAPGGGAEPPEPAEEALGPLEELNRRFTAAPEAGQFWVFGRDTAPGAHGYVRYSKTAFRDLLQHRRVPAGDRTRPLGDAWLDWARRNQARGVTFDPEGEYEGRGYLNLWTGWGVEPRPGEWPLLRELVEEVLCQGDRRSSEYVLDWCAHMVRRPARPAEVALVFKGRRGTGKSTFAGQVLGRIAGRHGRCVSKGLTGRFNGFLRQCVYVFAEEAFWAGDKAAEGQLKAMITERELVFEDKNVNPIQARNCLHLVVASNNEWVVPAALEDERRFAIFEVGDERRGDFAWWDALHRELEGGGLEAFMAHLLERDLGDWHPRRDVPQTSGLAGQKLQSLPPIDLWWFSVLAGGELPAEVPEGADEPPRWEDGPVEVDYRAVQSSFRHHAGRGAGTERAVATQLGMRLRRMVPGLRTQRRRGGSYRGYVFPSLAECRASFEAMAGARIDWDR